MYMKIEREQSRYQLPFHSPGCHHFDRSDPRLVICEAIHNGGDASQNFLISMFVTMEHGVQMQDIQPKSERADQLLFVAVPHLYFIKNTDISDTGDSPMETSIGLLLLRKTMREFIGLDENDDKAVEAMVNFSYYLCLGQMDNAFKSMKFIKNDSVWDHMARMCVKTRRIDVARVCLGNMHNARAARNIRLSVERGESVDMQAAQLAIELGMLDEARSIYQSIGRFDNLNKLYQSELKWNEAFAVAEKQDRVSLRNTFFNYAKYLEENGAIEAAIDNYHSSGVGEFNIPRMLFANPKSLESYVKRVRDPKFHVWWARYLESYGDITTAKNFYKIADDHFDLVRLLCMEDQMDEAEEIVSKTDSPLAAFHMAQQYEHRGEVDKAVNYFSKAKAYGSAIRLAKENDMVDKLANLALQAGGKCLTEAAVFYEDRPGYADKAVMLYHKAGLIGRALDLAFKTDQQSSLDLIVQELDEKSDPRTLERAAQFFANNQQDRKAIQLLAYAKKYQEAINLCRERNVVVTEELAELLTPPKGEASTNAARNALLTEVAKCCQHQGNYHFAAKKFTQAGNKIEAMRALLKSGDTPKIVLFTNTARNKDIYRMAGNYLQTLAWHDDVDVMKNIETFYIKGEALDSLASFYKACAALEIEEFRDYEKGMRAMEASLKAINNKITKEGGEQKSLNFREEVTEIMKNIQRFLRAKELYKTDVGEALREFQALLEVPGIEESVRRGDLYAILIMHNAKRQNFDKAYQIMQECLSKKPRIDIRKFMNTELLDQICDRTGNPRITVAATTAGGSDDEIDGGVDFSHAMQRRMSEEGGMSDSDNDF
uniref:TPR_REGION domain-containing protein n=1 Tax=Panagrellus redivivus TaxID=6233 RepID=A0A7E4V608_PANRE